MIDKTNLWPCSVREGSTTVTPKVCQGEVGMYVSWGSGAPEVILSYLTPMTLFSHFLSPLQVLRDLSWKREEFSWPWGDHDWRDVRCAWHAGLTGGWEGCSPRSNKERSTVNLEVMEAGDKVCCNSSSTVISHMVLGSQNSPLMWHFALPGWCRLVYWYSSNSTCHCCGSAVPPFMVHRHLKLEWSVNTSNGFRIRKWQSLETI